MTLPRLLGIALAKAVFLTCLAFMLLVAPTDAATNVAPRPHPPGSPAALIEAHGCWTGEAPSDMAGKVPGHVVVKTRGGRVVYGGPRMVAKALGQIFDGESHGLRVMAFCP